GPAGATHAHRVSCVTLAGATPWLGLHAQPAHRCRPGSRRQRYGACGGRPHRLLAPQTWHHWGGNRDHPWGWLSFTGVTYAPVITVLEAILELLARHCPGSAHGRSGELRRGGLP